MSTISERIIMISEKECNGNMSEFARRTKVTPAYISKLKNNPNAVPSDMFIDKICDEFGVCKKWLQTGKGEMFESANAELLAFLGTVAQISDEDTPGNIFKKNVITALSKLSPQFWEDVAIEFERIANKE